MKLPVYFCHFSALLLTISAVSALTLQIDFNDSGVTQRMAVDCIGRQRTGRFVVEEFPRGDRVGCGFDWFGGSG